MSLFSYSVQGWLLLNDLPLSYQSHHHRYNFYPHRLLNNLLYSQKIILFLPFFLIFHHDLTLLWSSSSFLATFSSPKHFSYLSYYLTINFSVLFKCHKVVNSLKLHQLSSYNLWCCHLNYLQMVVWVSRKIHSYLSKSVSSQIRTVHTNSLERDSMTQV
jgi:hypothetical protein